jgi:hypothetical protein
MTKPGHASSPYGDETIHRYVAGRLTGAELESFELHLLTCEQCRSDVREGVTIAASLARPAKARMITPRRVAMWSAGLAAAVIVALIIPRDTPLVRLSRLDSPPAFGPLAVRASVTPTDRLVDSAMASYVARDYRAARALLKRATEMGARGGVDFYFGAASLADGVPVEAVEPLARLLSDGSSPYADDARLLLAKALVGSGRTDSAETVLAAARDVRARAFGDSLRSLRAP